MIKLDTKEDAVAHITSLVGESGKVRDMHDEIIGEIPDRAEMYKAQLGQDFTETYVEAFKADRLAGGQWRVLVKRGNVWHQI